jgi:hypothetical protein
MDEVLRAIFGSDGSSPMVIDMSDVVQRNKKFELHLTENQRKSIIEFCNLFTRLRKKLEFAGEGKQKITVTRKELDELNDRIGSSVLDAPAIHRKRLRSVHSQVAELFAGDDHENLVRHNRRNTKSKKPSGQIYQFKITLLDTKPKIWRRIQIPDCKLNTLHYHIQAVMGWNNSHLHHFIIGRERYGIPKLLDDPMLGSKVIDSTKTMLSDLLPTSGQRFKFEYTYDMGDNWEHEVLFEGVVNPDPKVKYPVCLEGERSAPPEDCGGTPGYEHLLEVLADPGQEEYHDALHWVGDGFDPAFFDPRIATVRMVRGLRG